MISSTNNLFLGGSSNFSMVHQDIWRWHSDSNIWENTNKTMQIPRTFHSISQVPWNDIKSLC